MYSKEGNENISGREGQVPRHIAVIMDGSGRWAQQRHLPRIAGHKTGVEAVRRIVRACSDQGIGVLSLFTFSSENWRRPRKEVALLMDLFRATIEREVEQLHRNNVRLLFIGERMACSEKMRENVAAAEQLTGNNTGLVLVIAVNYGGRWDITQAVKKIAGKVVAGDLATADITPELFASHLSLNNLPEPDLFIRTGGEQRVSNFLLWHLAYTELYFTDILWPDFDNQALTQAILSFSGRQRRFGKTGEQVEQSPDS